MKRTKLSATCRDWRLRFLELKAFQKKRGHCDVPRNWRENPDLARWAVIQRNMPGRLSDDQLETLCGLGFDFGVRQNHWLEMYFELVRYRRRYGHCDVPHYAPGHVQLSTWVHKQRKRFHQRRPRTYSQIPPDQKRRLDGLGFSWDPIRELWEKHFKALLEFKRANGHCRVPYNGPGDQELSHWVVLQRYTHKKGRLPEDRVERLNRVGFDWSPSKSFWNYMYQKLIEFHRAHGHCSVPTPSREHRQLGGWVKRNRQGFERLPRSQRLLLEKLGFGRNAFDQRFDAMFNRLLEFKKLHGHCSVPSHSYHCKSLARWVDRIRKIYRLGRLSRERIHRLDGVGFTWHPAASNWDERLSELAAFKQRHGHCRVGCSGKSGAKLESWCQHLRERRRKGRLTPAQVGQLSDLGFDFNPSISWNSMYRQMAAFHQEHGHCFVPRTSREHQRLYSWVGRNRRLFERLSPARKCLLEKLDVWKRPQRALSKRGLPNFEPMLKRFIEFKRRHGHCRVPSRTGEFRPLALWAIRARQLRAAGRLPDSQIQSLNHAGFVWNPRASRWEQRIKELGAFKKEHGHCRVTASSNAPAVLQNWRCSLLERKRLKTLLPEQIKQLADLGFTPWLLGSRPRNQPKSSSQRKN